MKTRSVRSLTIGALLIAMGILIPMMMPKIVIGPASFTLASHVPVMLAMFFSPTMAIAVALGTTFGFLVTTPLIIAARALTHVVFATIGAFYLQRHPQTVAHPVKFQLFNFVMAMIHAVAEVAMVWAFYATGSISGATIDQNFFGFLFGLLGVGGILHSMIDFTLAFFIAKNLSRLFYIPVFAKAKAQSRTFSEITLEKK